VSKQERQLSQKNRASAHVDIDSQVSRTVKEVSKTFHIRTYLTPLRISTDVV